MMGLLIYVPVMFFKGRMNLYAMEERKCNGGNQVVLHKMSVKKGMYIRNQSSSGVYVNFKIIQFL